MKRTDKKRFFPKAGMLFLPAALCAFSLLSFSARAAGEMPRQAMPFITAIEAGEEPNTLRMRFSHGAAPAAAGYRLTVWINDVLLQVRTLSPAADKVWEYPLNSPLTGGDTVRFTVQAIGDYQTTSHSLTNTMQVVIRRLTAPEEPQVSQGIIDDGGQGRLILRFRRVANARAYRLVLSVNGIAQPPQIVEQPQNGVYVTHTLENYTYRKGDLYSFSVQAIGDGVLTHDSEAAFSAAVSATQPAADLQIGPNTGGGLRFRYTGAQGVGYLRYAALNNKPVSLTLGRNFAATAAVPDGMEENDVVSFTVISLGSQKDGTFSTAVSHRQTVSRLPSPGRVSIAALSSDHIRVSFEEIAATKSYAMYCRNSGSAQWRTIDPELSVQSGVLTGEITDFPFVADGQLEFGVVAKGDGALLLDSRPAFAYAQTERLLIPKNLKISYVGDVLGNIVEISFEPAQQSAHEIVVTAASSAMLSTAVNHYRLGASQSALRIEVSSGQTVFFSVRALSGAENVIPSPFVRSETVTISRLAAPRGFTLARPAASGGPYVLTFPKMAGATGYVAVLRYTQSAVIRRFSEPRLELENLPLAIDVSAAGGNGAHNNIYMDSQSTKMTVQKYPAVSSDHAGWDIKPLGSGQPSIFLLRFPSVTGAESYTITYPVSDTETVQKTVHSPAGTVSAISTVIQLKESYAVKRFSVTADSFSGDGVIYLTSEPVWFPAGPAQ